MDIVRKIKPIKARFEKLSIKYKFILLAILASLSNIILPHGVLAFQQPENYNQQHLIFVLGSYEKYMFELNRKANHAFVVNQLKQEMEQKQKLTLSLANYLQTNSSPLAQYADVLVELKNWKKIIALSNAESSMCRKYVIAKSNCWGVGGNNLWEMGDNLGEGVSKMDYFLNHYPLKSKVKYSQMTFEQMNGLYKQPAGDHWVYNNARIYDELNKLEQSL